jgi:cytochrome c556
MTAFRPSKLLQATLLVALVPALAVAATPAAAPSPQAAIAQRQAGYKNMGAAMKALNEQLKSDAPSKDEMVRATRTIGLTAREQVRLFPVGSGASAGVKTDALPNIWTDRATFDANMAKLVGESGRLFNTANTGNVGAIRTQAAVVGATCKSCHRQFRADN